MLIWLLIFVGIYAAIVLLMFLFQERLIFVGASFSGGEPDTIQGVEIEWIERESGDRFRVAHSRPPHAQGVIVCFVGNGEDLRSGVYHAARWLEYGLEAFVVEYPGYGESEGSPGIESIYSAARAAARVAQDRAAELDVPLFAAGTSLGTFSAMYVATEFPVERLVLSAPPTSLADAARGRFPWLPIDLLLRHRFDNLALAPAVNCPVWIVHGSDDRVVPWDHGRRLAAALQAEFETASGFGHMIPLQRQGPWGDRIRTFLAGPK